MEADWITPELKSEIARLVVGAYFNQLVREIRELTGLAIEAAIRGDMAEVIRLQKEHPLHAGIVYQSLGCRVDWDRILPTSPSDAAPPSADDSGQCTKSPAPEDP